MGFLKTKQAINGYTYSNGTGGKKMDTWTYNVFRGTQIHKQ